MLMRFVLTSGGDDYALSGEFTWWGDGYDNIQQTNTFLEKRLFVSGFP